MKKKIAILGAATILSVTAHAFTGSITAGFEGTSYENLSTKQYSRSDKIVPYLKLAVKPFPGKQLQIDASYYNTQEYNKYKAISANDKFRSGEEQYEMIFRGYQYKNGGYAFSPRVGFRINTYDINDSRLVSNTPGVASSSVVARRIQYRFYPNMTYNLNKQTQLYLSGWVGPVTFETRGRGRTETSSANITNWGANSKRTYTNNWRQEVEVIGIKHTFSNKNSVYSSLYNERSYEEYSTKYNRWQYRIGGDYRLTENLVLKPYTRIDLDYNQTNIAGNAKKGNKEDKRDRESVRIAVAADYRIDSDWSLTGEVYWNIEKQATFGNGVSDPSRKAWFYSFGVTRKF